MEDYLKKQLEDNWRTTPAKKKMEDDLKIKIEDDLKKNVRQPQKKMLDNLKKNKKNGRQPQKNKYGKQTGIFLKDDLKTN